MRSLRRLSQQHAVDDDTSSDGRGGVIATTEVFFALGGIVACLVQLAVQEICTGPWGVPNGMLFLSSCGAAFADHSLRC